MSWFNRRTRSGDDTPKPDTGCKHCDGDPDASTCEHAGDVWCGEAVCWGHLPGSSRQPLDGEKDARPEEWWQKTEREQQKRRPKLNISDDRGA